MNTDEMSVEELVNKVRRGLEDPDVRPFLAELAHRAVERDHYAAKLAKLRAAAEEVERLFHLPDEEYTEEEGGVAFARLRAALSLLVEPKRS